MKPSKAKVWNYMYINCFGTQVLMGGGLMHFVSGQVKIAWWVFTRIVKCIQLQ